MDNHEPIYSNSEEKYMKTVVLYGDRAYKVVSFSPETIIPVDSDLLFDLCMKDLILVCISYNDSDYYLKPLAFYRNADDGDTVIEIKDVTNSSSFSTSKFSTIVGSPS